MLLGVHVSTQGKIYEAVERAHELGCNTMQIFSRNPQRWREKSLKPQDIKEFNRRRQAYKISPLFIHVPYLINLASPNPALYRDSIKAYIEDIKEAASLKADYLVTHMGSHKETSEAAGIERITKALDRITSETKGSNVGILLENTAGAGSWLGYNFKHQREILCGLKERKGIGFCLDTAHAYLAGYDISTKPGLDAAITEIDDSVGINLLKLIHLNDAKDKLGTHYDRHAHIGKGTIGMAGMKRIINHPKLKNIAFILETPKDSKDADKINLRTVRKLRQ